MAKKQGLTKNVNITAASDGWVVVKFFESWSTKKDGYCSKEKTDIFCDGQGLGDAILEYLGDQ